MWAYMYVARHNQRRIESPTPADGSQKEVNENYKSDHEIYLKIASGNIYNTCRPIPTIERTESIGVAFSQSAK
jgi:hypothetical protein